LFALAVLSAAPVSRTRSARVIPACPPLAGGYRPVRPLPSGLLRPSPSGRSPNASRHPVVASVLWLGFSVAVAASTHPCGGADLTSGVSLASRSPVRRCTNYDTSVAYVQYPKPSCHPDGG